MSAIKRAYIRHYSDNGQTTACIEWANSSRTEGPVNKVCPCCGRRGVDPRGLGPHMSALFSRAMREGVKIETETW